MKKCPVSIFLAMSLDGYIAGPDGNLDFLSVAESAGEDYGYSEFVAQHDTVIMGRNTYEKVMLFDVEFPYSQKKCYVFSNREGDSNPDVEFVKSKPADLIARISRSGSSGIYCDGGANLIQQMITGRLIDRFVISVIPVMLGNGIPLFDKQEFLTELKLQEAKSYKTGLVKLTYLL